MAHYAVLDENNVVIDVFVGRDEDEVVDGISDWEAYYTEIKGMTCKRTSYNTRSNTHSNGGIPYRYNYAAIGGTFDPSIGPDGAFIGQKPSPSYVLDINTCSWKPPISPPEDNEILDGIWGKYTWSEEDLAWVINPEWQEIKSIR